MQCTTLFPLCAQRRHSLIGRINDFSAQSSNIRNNKVTCVNPSKSVVSILLLSLSSSISFAQDKPNIVILLADNLGYGDLSSYGGPVPTPRIDALAAEGVRFENFNTEAQCTPTRGALHDGSHAYPHGYFQRASAGYRGSLRSGPLVVHHRGAILGCRLCHGLLRQVALGQSERAGSHGPGF